MLIRIEGSDLPGRECGQAPDFPGYRNIHVGVQRKGRRDALLDLHPGDVSNAVWELEVLDAAVDSGLLVARLGLTDRCGQPLCAAVRPPLVNWSAPVG